LLLRSYSLKSDEDKQITEGHPQPESNIHEPYEQKADQMRASVLQFV